MNTKKIFIKHNSSHNRGFSEWKFTLFVMVWSGIDLDELWSPKYTVPNTGLIIFKTHRMNNQNKYRFERVLLKNPVPHL